MPRTLPSVSEDDHLLGQGPAPRRSRPARSVTGTRILAASLVVLGPRWVFGLWGSQDGAFGVDGSFRTMAMGLDDRPLSRGTGSRDDVEFLSRSLLRLTGVGRPCPGVTVESHAVWSLNHMTPGHGGDQTFLGVGVASPGVRYQAADATWVWVTGDSTSGLFFPDRLNAKIAIPWADITLGRQAITFGEAYFWNPLDVFLPFDPRQLDRDYKTGVDALRVDIPLGDFSAASAVAALGRELSGRGHYVHDGDVWSGTWYASALLGRLVGTVHGWEWTAQGGKVYGGFQAGVGGTGEVGPVELRFEATQLFAERSASPREVRLTESHWCAVLGAGHRFGNSLTLEAEYLRNGAGETDSLDTAVPRWLSGGTPNLSRHLVGFLTGYDVTPLATAQVTVLVSLGQPSFQCQPSVRISLTDESELRLGMIVNVGPGPGRDGLFGDTLRSEFGSQPNSLYAQFTVHF